MEMIRVVSTAISRVGYDESTGRMTVEFKAGHSYDYCGVPKRVFEELIRASSVGNYFNTEIRDRYEC